MEKEKNGLVELIPYIAIIVLVLLIKQFICTTVIVHGASMEDTLHDKDIMFLDRIGTKITGIKRFDIVVVDTDDSKIIKRVIGLPGETIEYKDNKLYIDGKEIKDNHSDKVTSDFGPVRLGKDYYYVLGDNRTNSVDSRMIGPIPKSKIMGHARFTIFPLNRFGVK